MTDMTTPHQSGSPHDRHHFMADLTATENRINTLRAYMAEHVLDGKHFVCDSHPECEASTLTKCSFSEGHLSHIGKHFDIASSGGALRVVVVGRQASAAGHSRTTMAERYRAIHDDNGMGRRLISDREHKQRSPHMRGTTLALRTIFGKRAGIDHAGEFIDLPNGPTHVFDCFALLNRLLCSSHLIETSSGRPTKTMVRNCERHFRATLHILEPTIVVLQGAKVWDWSKQVMIPREQLSDHLFRCSLSGAETLVCTFMHPSSWGSTRWDSPSAPYFREVVEPTLQKALEMS